MGKLKNHFQRLLGDDWVEQLEEIQIEGEDNGQ